MKTTAKLLLKYFPALCTEIYLTMDNERYEEHCRVMEEMEQDLPF